MLYDSPESIAKFTKYGLHFLASSNFADVPFNAGCIDFNGFPTHHWAKHDFIAQRPALCILVF